MSPRLRLAVLGIALLALLPGAAATITHLPEFGATIAAYGERINAITPGERHVANMVSAINFDLRGLDTLGDADEAAICATKSSCKITGGLVFLSAPQKPSPIKRCIMVRSRPGKEASGDGKVKPPNPADRGSQRLWAGTLVTFLGLHLSFAASCAMSL